MKKRHSGKSIDPFFDDMPSIFEHVFLAKADDPCVNLWRAVVNVALLDAASKTKQKAAQSWISSQSEDFKVVCELAGWDPDYIAGVAKKIPRAGIQQRTAAGTSKYYMRRRIKRMKLQGKSVYLAPVAVKMGLCL